VRSRIPLASSPPASRDAGGLHSTPTSGLRAIQDVLAAALQQQGSLKLATISLAHPMLLVRS
jgi:hypothetical protein